MSMSKPYYLVPQGPFRFGIRKMQKRGSDNVANGLSAQAANKEVERLNREYQAS